MAVRGVVIAEHVQHLDDLDAGRVARHDDHRLLAVGRRVGIALAHQDDDLAARIAHARRPPLAAVDDIVVAVALDAALDVARVGRGDRRLGHGEAGADLAVEQRLQPLLLVLLGAVAGEHFHVAGVGRRAVDRLGGDRGAAEDLADRRVFEVGEAHRAVRVAAVAVGRQEHVPQAALLRLGLALLQDGRELPAILGLLHLLLVDRLRRIDDLVHELEELLLQVPWCGPNIRNPWPSPWSIFWPALCRTEYASCND